MPMKNILIVCILYIAVCTCDWTLSDMGKSYFEATKPGTEILDDMDSRNYKPITRGFLCSNSSNLYKSCGLRLKILVLDQLPVMATQLGCGKRMYHLLEGLVGVGHEVYMAYIRPDSHETQVDKELMNKLGVPVLLSPLLIRDVKDDFKKILYMTQPVLIIMTLWYWQTDKPWFNAPGLFLAYTRKNHPNTRLIILTDDVHWLRLQKLLLSSQKLSKPSDQKLNVKRDTDITGIRVSEYFYYNSADAVITISATDKKNILRYDTNINHDLKNKEKIFVVPFVASPWETQNPSTVPPFLHRRGIIFVGNMENPTNIEGLRWFIDVVLPQLAIRIPTLSFTIIGGGDWPLPIPPNPPIRYLGWLSWEQMRQELNSARVFVSPIVVSTGVNTKNSLAMSNGIPLVTTKIGASGLCDNCDDYPVSVDAALDNTGGMYFGSTRGSSFIAAADEFEFLRGVLELYHDEVIWNAYSKAGIHNAQEYLSVKSATLALEQAILFTKPFNHSF